MHARVLLGALLVTAIAARARAEEPAVPSSSSLSPPTSPPPAPAAAISGPAERPLAAPEGSATPASPASVSPPPPTVLDQLHAELAREAASIEDLRGALAEEKHAREHPFLRVDGFVQIDWVIHNQESQDEINGSTGQPLNQDRFTLRRGHLRVNVEKGLFEGTLEIDANTTSGPQVRPFDAEVGIHWPQIPDEKLPQLRFSVGLQRIPFGFENPEKDYVRPFLERATVVTAMFPGENDLGATLSGRYRFVEWAFAAMNGNPLGDLEFPDLDPVQTKDALGRVGVDFEIVPGVRFQAGASADTGTGFHAGTPASGNVLVWQDQNGDGLVQPSEITAIGGEPATPSQQFRRWAVGGDARLIVRIAPLGNLAFRAEIIDAQNLDRGVEPADPIGVSHDLRELGWYVGATQEITRWGILGARYDRYNPDADASQQRALNLVPIDRSYSTLALTGILRYESARLLFEYDINSNPLGVGANGSPITLADNAVTLRGQLVF